MLIKNIKIKNFRQYKNVYLEFSTDKDKNLTVILGENGYGKTTLVRAFLWCLYRDNAFKNPVLLNDEVAKNMKPGEEETVSVTLNLIHAGINYRITTTELYRKGLYGDISISSKASTNVIKDTTPLYYGAVDSEINKLLKKDVKDYFFYDGENNKIESMSKKSLNEAVSQMMGIKRLENLRTYFQTSGTSGVIGTLTRKISESDIALRPLQDKLDIANQEKARKLKLISDNLKQIDDLEKQYQEKMAVIDANKDIEEDQKEIKKLKHLVADNQSKIDFKFDSMINQFNGKNNGLLKTLFANCYAKKRMNELESTSSFGTKESLSHISEEAIDQLIKRGYCLCGAKIENENDAYKHLIEAKSHMEPHDFGKYLSDFCTSEENNAEYVKTTCQNIKQTTEDFLEDIENIEIDKDRIKELNEKLEGRQDIGQYQIDANRIHDQIGQLKGQNVYISTSEIPLIDKEIEQLSNKIIDAAEKTQENKLLKLCKVYAENIYADLDKKVRKAQDETRIQLEKDVNEIFSAIYHGNRIIKIDNDFNVETITNESNLDNSTGTETVKNFAFVAGLLKSIKNNVLLEELDEEGKMNEIYPLVMDAPFSDTDAVHISNICKTLPKYCDQIFIVVMNHHYNLAKEEIKNKVGKIYQINKHSETFDTVEEIENV